MVGIFPNEAAITRLVSAILLEQSDEWAVQRARYMTLETMGSLRECCRQPANLGRLTNPALPGTTAINASYTTPGDTIGTFHLRSLAGSDPPLALVLLDPA